MRIAWRFLTHRNSHILSAWMHLWTGMKKAAQVPDLSRFK